MTTLSGLIENFFTHKDFLPPANEIAGTLFSPLHIVFAIVCALAIVFLARAVSKRSEETIRKILAVLWISLVILEISKITWESLSGAVVSFEWTGVLPLYPCSVFMYALPFAIWGKERVRYAACGYCCSLGLLGGAINFIYPANILGNYSCISFAGFHTFLYHGSLVFCTIVMIKSGYHTYKKAHRWYDLLLPAMPALSVSILANLVNFSRIDSDYMFFKLESFFFAPLGAATPDWLSVILVYLIYLVIHALPYIPYFIKNKRTVKATA